MAVTESSRTAASPLAAPVLSRTSYVHLQNFIHSESGIAIGPDKQYLLESRLLPILKQESIASLDALATLLTGKPSSRLRRLVVEAMTTHETLFFRDTAMFDALRKEVLPGLFSKGTGGRKLRIWSAAASSGQEAYSLAMLALELGKGSSDVEIHGTDLSAHVLERAREGLYGTFEIGRGISPAFLQKYFDKRGAEWQIKEPIRRMVRFEQRDLRDDVMALGKFDLVLCRNVLIYLDPATKQCICQALRSVLQPDGLLALGAGEILPASVSLRRVSIAGSTFYSL